MRNLTIPVGLFMLLALSSCGEAQNTDSLARPLRQVKNGNLLPQIETHEQMLLYVNAQNLAARWNNIIVAAKTGDQQLKWMRESGVFAENFQIKFRLPDRTELTFNDLNEGPKEFYNGFVNPLKKRRVNAVTNVEVIEFLSDGLKFRFRYFIFMDETLSLTGDSECVMRKVNGRYRLVSAEIQVGLLNTKHAH